MSQTTVANPDDVRILGLDSVEIDGIPNLRIRGLVFHSALAVGAIEVRAEGQAQRLLITMTPARTGLSGAFEANVPIPANVHHVLFGAYDAAIWQRD